MKYVDIWFRPWAFYSPANERAKILIQGDAEVPADQNGTVWIVTNIKSGPIVDGKEGNSEAVAKLPDGRQVYAMPLPLKQAKGLILETPLGKTLLRMQHVPDAPTKDYDPDGGLPSNGDLLMLRVKQIWARLREVEDSIADPATLWSRLCDLWVRAKASDDPEMDVIVKQARRLGRVIDQLDKSPRRILRRTHKQMPLSQVQELDRRAMTWLIRQPGETIAERAGDRQRIQGIAREENFNTLENRVLMTYALLANLRAKEYAPSDLKRVPRRREIVVRAFGKRCKHLAADFRKRGILEARPDATPNFVLQNNSNYHAIWEAWHELLTRQPVLDELWRWQARSWEEFCALALMVALQSIDGAELIATSPIVFRDEQQRGQWVENVNPLGVVRLAAQQLIVEVQYSWQTDNLANFCAPIWLRVGKVGDSESFLARLAVWPMWNPHGGLVAGEAAELDRIIGKASVRDLLGALVIRPHEDGGVKSEISGNVAQVTLGSAGESLRGGVTQLAETVCNLLVKGAG